MSEYMCGNTQVMICILKPKTTPLFLVSFEFQGKLWFIEETEANLVHHK